MHDRIDEDYNAARHEHAWLLRAEGLSLKEIAPRLGYKPGGHSAVGLMVRKFGARVQRAVRTVPKTWQPGDLIMVSEFSDAALVRSMGTDPAKWARTFRRFAERRPHMRHDWLVGWFAAAIEAGRTAGQKK